MAETETNINGEDESGRVEEHDQTGDLSEINITEEEDESGQVPDEEDDTTGPFESSADAPDFHNDRRSIHPGVGSESGGLSSAEEIYGYESGLYSIWVETMAEAMIFLSGEQTTAGADSESGGLSEGEISRRLKLITREGKDEDDDDDAICAVCLDDLCQTDEKIGVLECGHEYHHCCIKNWLQKKNLCPLCKRVALPVSPCRKNP